MHGAGLSTGISCQKSTIKSRASSYITKKKEERKNLKQCQRKAEVKQELLQHSNSFFAQMASTVACHIVLPQGCTAADVKENLFAGLYACYAESLFKHALIR